MEFEGIYPPVITPFNDDQSVDERGWADMIDYQIENGAHGVVIGGTTGEFYALTRDERLDQFRKAPDVVGGRVPWLAGVNDFQTESVCAYASAAKEAGADALLLAAPPYALPTERELAAHCLRVERAAKLPIMLYNYPGRTGVMMGEEFLERVGRNANFCAIKESSGDIHRIHLLAREFPHLQLSCGIDDLALEFFVWGARSWVCAAANCALPETLALFEACVVERDFEKGRRIMQALLPLSTVLERGGKFLQCIKFACELQGLPGGGVRLPQRPMTKELRRQMADVMLTVQKTVRAIVAESAARTAPKGPRPVSVDEVREPAPKRASARASSD